VRLPRAFRVDAGEVRIRRRGRAIVLEPVPEPWEWLDALAGDVDADFVSAVREQPEARSGPGSARCSADAVSPGRERHHCLAE
jgi:antitoxin VapB